MQAENRPIRAVACLGNLGASYEGTPHNAGFIWLDRHLERSGAAVAMASSEKCKADLGTDGEGLLLIRPLTFMNCSGGAVAAAMKHRSWGADQLLVVHDEMDLPPGSARLKFGGGAAGHKGVADVAARLGTRDFWRLRLGIGHGEPRADASAHVLKRMEPRLRKSLDESIECTLNLLPLLRAGKMDDAMRRLHARLHAKEAECP